MEEKKKLVTIDDEPYYPAEKFMVSISNRSGFAGDRKHLANLIRKVLVEQIPDKGVEQEKSAEQSTLAKELDQALGQEKFKALGQDIALVIAEHKLTNKPEICDKVFRYMSFVVFGWNEEVNGMDAEKYLAEKQRLSQAMNGQENLDSVVTAITDALKRYNLNLMPGTAFDVMMFTLETIHLGSYNAPKRSPFHSLG